MNTALRWLLLLTLALGAGLATAAAVVPPTPLLLVSIDAYRPDYLNRELSPTLAMLARDGVRATSMQPAFPTLTFPNHYTIVTGRMPDHHGIVANTMRDPLLGSFSLRNRQATGDGRWWAQATPIWETAARHGLRTATMFWPGSEAAIHGMRPTLWRPYDGEVTSTQRVDQVLAWLDLPVAQRPAFLTLYFDAVDHAGHDWGPDTPQVNAALRETDAALARLVAGLRQRGVFDRINLIVVSDHGMAAAPLQQRIRIDRLVDLDRVQTVGLGVLAGFNPRDSSAKARAQFATIARKLQRPQAHMRCWDRRRVPARFAYGRNPRVPQLLCLANVGWRIAAGDTTNTGKPPKRGEHGYDNADPRMQAIFIAHGPAFRNGVVVPSFPNVDVYPLMTHLLGIPAAANDGDFEAVRGMLRDQPQP
ncbi:MAG: ectonucleotide pyrophosphatase/phosphodiesterase [Rhodanobacter sp.]